MDADRSREPLNDLDVDRELQSLLAADPSPEFVARIRSRIASEPGPSQSSVAGLQLPTASAGWWPWKFAVGIAAAAAVVVLAVAISRPRTSDVAPQTLTATALANTSTTMAALKGRPYISTDAAPPLATTDVGRAATTIDVGRPFEGRREEVVLDARETATLRALIRGVRRGDVDLEPVLRASTPSAMELPPIAEIAIAPITIAPLVDEGVRQ